MVPDLDVTQTAQYPDLRCARLVIPNKKVAERRAKYGIRIGMPRAPAVSSSHVQKSIQFLAVPLDVSENIFRHTEGIQDETLGARGLGGSGGAGRGGAVRADLHHLQP